MDFSIRLDGLPAGRPGLVIGFGVFDGVHRGHRLIMEQAAELAAECRALPAAVTFVPHPRAALSGEGAPELLISVEERLKRLREAGARITGIIDFTPAFGALEPEEFLDSLTERRDFRLAGICVGEDWRFGSRGRGDAAMLEAFARRRDLKFRAVKRLRCDGVNISSSIIRELIRQGELEWCRKLLGRPPRLAGTVSPGFHIAGRELNAPTANLALEYGVLPPDGVYAGESEVDGKRFPAVLNIGFAPTYGGSERRIEIHLPGFSGDLYHRALAVELVKFLRPERKFPSPAELRARIVRDIAETNAIFNNRNQEEER